MFLAIRHAWNERNVVYLSYGTNNIATDSPTKSKYYLLQSYDFVGNGLIHTTMYNNRILVRGKDAEGVNKLYSIQ